MVVCVPASSPMGLSLPLFAFWASEVIFSVYRMLGTVLLVFPSGALGPSSETHSCLYGVHHHALRPPHLFPHLPPATLVQFECLHL